MSADLYGEYSIYKYDLKIIMVEFSLSDFAYLTTFVVPIIALVIAILQYKKTQDYKPKRVEILNSVMPPYKSSKKLFEDGFLSGPENFVNNLLFGTVDREWGLVTKGSGNKMDMVLQREIKAIMEESKYYFGKGISQHVVELADSYYSLVWSINDKSYIGKSNQDIIFVYRAALASPSSNKESKEIARLKKSIDSIDKEKIIEKMEKRINRRI